MSNNLNVDQMPSKVENPHTIHNDSNGQLDAAMTEPLAVLVDNTNAATLTDSGFRRHHLFKIQEDAPAPTGDITITVPGGATIKRGLFVVLNETAQKVIVEISGQSEASPEVLAGLMEYLESDGDDIRGSSAISGVYDIGTWYGGTPGATELVMSFLATRSFTIPSGMTTSRGFAGTAPSAQTDFDVQRSGVSVGTMRWPNAVQTATFIMASGTTWTAGQYLDVIGPAVLNGIANMRWTFAATR